MTSKITKDGLLSNPAFNVSLLYKCNYRARDVHIPKLALKKCCVECSIVFFNISELATAFFNHTFLVKLYNFT